MAPYGFANESFEASNGSISGYITSITTQATVTPQVHYNLRSFYSAHRQSSRTMDDLTFWNVAAFQGITMDEMQTITLQGTKSFNSQGILDTYQQSYLDKQNQSSIEYAYVDNEQWTNTSTYSGTLMTLQADPAYRYANTLRVVMSGTNPEGSFSSTFNSDDIITNYNNPSETYYIELVLTGFPGQSSTPRVDLNNSYIDFSSDNTGNYSGTVTDSIPFSLSEYSLNFSSTQDAYFRVNRNLLTKCDLTAITNIRFRLTCLGTGTIRFIFRQMRVVSASEFDDNAETLIDTKIASYVGTADGLGNFNAGSMDSGDLIMNASRFKNLTQITKRNIVTGKHRGWETGLPVTKCFPVTIGRVNREYWTMGESLIQPCRVCEEGLRIVKHFKLGGRAVG